MPIIPIHENPYLFKILIVTQNLLRLFEFLHVCIQGTLPRLMCTSGLRIKYCNLLYQHYRANALRKLSKNHTKPENLGESGGNL